MREMMKSGAVFVIPMNKILIPSTVCPYPLAWQKGSVKIGNLNFILLGLIVLIVLGLLLKEPQSSKVDIPVKTQAASPPQSVAVRTENAEVDIPDEQPTAPHEQSNPVQAATKKTHKAAKKEQIHQTMAEASAPQAGSEVQSTSVEPISEAPKESQKDMIVFNIWSVSELRLRAAYIKLMNDGSVGASQTDSRKKEYLNFVAGRTRKCGELDTKFASNINSVEKLTFHKAEIAILECHTAENIIELNRLNKLNGAES